MILIALFALAGIAWGIYLARKRGGARSDWLHYGAAFGIAFGLLGLFATILIAQFA
ncbi:MAG: hypothetical protein AAFR35_14985 [Pseudomonadota bacterium]